MEKMLRLLFYYFLLSQRFHVRLIFFETMVSDLTKTRLDFREQPKNYILEICIHWHLFGRLV